jgi:hypothetical protein
MLKLERVARTQDVVIRLNSRASFLDKALWYAIFWSALVHLVLFGLFRIKVTDASTHAVLLDPIEVALVSDKLEREVYHTEVRPETSTPISKMPITELAGAYATLPIPSVPATPLQALAIPEQDIDHTHALQAMAPHTHEAMQACFQALPSQVQYYPLSLQLSKSLQDRALLDDGVHLFLPKKRGFPSSYFLSQPSISTEYRVQVDGQSGKVTSWQRRGELLDKALQSVAERLIRTLRFAPVEIRRTEGTILVTFHCTGDALQEWLAAPIDAPQASPSRRRRDRN